MGAHVLNLVGSVTANLYGGNDYTYLMGYEMRGGGPARNVTEQIKIQLHYAGDDSANTALRGKLADIVKVAAAAAEWQESRGRRGVQTFLEIQPGADGDTYRSEIVALEHNIAPDWIYGQWAAHVLDVVLTITRRNYWEDGDLVTLNAGGTTVYNHDDAGAGHDNYVAVAAASALGSLPAPVLVDFENTYNDPHEYTELWSGHGTWADVTNLAHILEGEDAAYVVGGAIATPDAGCSGGNYRQAVWAVGTETLLYRFDDLTRAYMNESMAKRFRLLVRFQAAPGAVTFRAALTFPAGTTTLELQTTGIVLADATNLLYDLGELDLPPWLERATSDWQAMSLCLYGQIAGGTSVNLDFIHLQPIDEGRHYRFLSGGIEYHEKLYDDPDTGHVYWQGTTTYKAGRVVATGDPLLLWPGRDQRYYFLWRDSGGADIAAQGLVLLKYRPRRQTL